MAKEFSFEEATKPEEFGFEEATPQYDQRQSTLSAAPPESMIGSGMRAIREFASPILGPTSRQVAQESVQMSDGTSAYRPAGSRIDREGMIGALFTQNPESKFYINRAEIDPQSSTASQVMTGARNVGANLVNTLSSPGSMLTMGAGSLMTPAASKVLGGAFAADVARHVPEMAQEAGTKSVTGTSGEIVESLGNLGLAGAGVLAGGVHAAQSTPRGNAIRAITEGLSKEPIRQRTGEFQSIGEFMAPYEKRNVADPSQPPVDANLSNIDKMLSGLRTEAEIKLFGDIAKNEQYPKHIRDRSERAAKGELSKDDMAALIDSIHINIGNDFVTVPEGLGAVSSNFKPESLFKPAGSAADAVMGGSISLVENSSPTKPAPPKPIEPQIGSLVSHDGYTGILGIDEAGRKVIQTADGAIVEIGESPVRKVVSVDANRAIEFDGETWKPRKKDWRENWLGGQFYVRNSKGERGVITGEPAKHIAQRMQELDSVRDAKFRRKKATRLGEEDVTTGVDQIPSESVDTPIDQVVLDSQLRREYDANKTQYVSPSTEPRVVTSSGQVLPDRQASTGYSWRANERALQEQQRKDLVQGADAAGRVPAQASAKQIDEMLGVGRPPVALDVAQKTIFDQAWEAALENTKNGKPGKVPKGYWERVNQWADHTIKEFPKKTRDITSLVDPSLAVAYSVKAAKWVGEMGVKTYEAFKKEFMDRFPDAEKYAKDVWERLSASDETIFKAIDEAKGVEGLDKATHRFGGSVTSLAYRIGERTTTPEQLARLQEGMAAVRRDSVALIEKMKKVASEGGDYVPISDEISAMSMKGQLYREAYEYATGTGSAGDYLRSKDPNWVPPVERASGDKILSALDKGIEFLKSDRTQIRSGLPTWLPREAARGVLGVIKAAYIGSKHLGNAIESGVKWLKEQGVKADDVEIKDWLDSQLRWERIGTEADTGPVKTRKSIERALSSEDVSQPVKEALAQDPNSKYQQQIVTPKKGHTSVTEIVDAQTNAQLEDATPNSSIYVAQKMELAKRMMKEGRDEAAYQVFSDLAEKGTTFGQLINQFKALKNVDPNYVVRLLNKQLQEHGYDPLTERQASSLAEKSKKAIEANDALEQAKKDWVEDPTDDNAKKAGDLLEELKEPALDLQRAMLDMQPKNLPSTLKAVIQGNLLTPASEVSNIAGNMAIMPARALSDAGAVMLDALDSMIRKKPRELVAQPSEGAKAGARGFAKGLSQAKGIAKEGISSVRTGENFRDLQPVKAWIRQFSKENLVPTKGGKIPLGDRAAMLIEGTVGIPAAAALRGLSIGDAPFREKAHSQAVEQQLELAKVPSGQREFARKFPELFLGEDAIKRIADETNQAVFQRHSNFVSGLNRMIRSWGKENLGPNGADWADLAFSVAAAPYRLTPWNLVGEFLAYTPAGMASVLANMVKGNKLGAERAFAKVVVGGMAAAAATWLYKNGLLSPSLDDEDEQQKARLLSGKVLPADHLNITGLKRAMAGGDPAFQPGDSTVGLEKLGIFGSIAHNTANIGRKKEKSPEGQGGGVMDWTIGQLPETAKFALNQSFLKGTTTVLDAARTGNFDDVLRNMENILVSVPLPNTLTAASRATSPSKVVIKDDSKLKELDNLIQQRLRVFGGGKNLPVKRGIWGEPIPETPEGANPFAYHFLDITKGQQVTQDPASVEIYRLWRRYNDPSVIPTPPSASMEINGERFVLNPTQQQSLGASVGQRRKFIVDQLVQNPNWSKLDDEAKRRMLKRAYESGARIGKLEFRRDFQSDLEAKGRPAGFVPEYQLN